MTETYALELDKNFKLKDYKSQFYVKEDNYYMNGNASGLLLKRSEKALLNALEDWKKLGIKTFYQAIRTL